MDKTQEERVLHWLKKRGYTEVAKHYEEDQAHGGDGTATGIEERLRRRVGEANQNALLFRSVHLADPSLLHRNYNELQTWTCNALEAYKPELLTVSFPVFVHCYLKLVERDMASAASAFLQTWGPEHAEYYQMELRSLAAVQRADQMEANPFVKRVLTDKFLLRLCSTSYRLLQGFLSDHNLLAIMEILNERVKVLIEERPPRERFEVVTFLRDGVPAGGAGGGRGHRVGGGGSSPVRARGNQLSVRWRISQPTAAEMQAGGGEVEKTIPVRCPFNVNLVSKLATVSRADVPKYLSEGGGNLSRMAGPKADANNPTVLMASLTNTYGGCIVARLTEDATQLAAGFQDRAVRVFRLAEGGGGGITNVKNPLVLRGHSQPVYGLTWSFDQQYLLSSSGDGTVRLWDVAQGRNLCIYRAPTDVPVWDVEFAPLGHYFITGSYDRVARVWSTNRTQPVRLLVGHYSDVSCVAWHPNCNYVVTGSWDKTARLWEMASGRCFRIYSGHFGPLTALAVSPNGQYLAGAGGAQGQGGVVRIWEIDSGREVALLVGHTSAIHSLAYNYEGTVLATAGQDETVRTWDLEGDFPALTSSLTLSPHSTFRTKATPVLDVEFTRRNLLLAVGPTSA